MCKFAVNMSHISDSELSEFSIQLFSAMGASYDDAKIATDVLVSADLRGIDSHGVSRLIGYVNLWELGRINMSPDIKIIRENKSTFTIHNFTALPVRACVFSAQGRLRRKRRRV